MPKILVTGSRGFIASGLCKRLSSTDKVIGIDCDRDFASPKNFVTRQTDLTDFNEVDQICKEHSPDVVIHCAGIAHQKIGAVDLSSYLRVNSEATEHLAKAASRNNPDLYFVFLSSISIYGENNLTTPITEDFVCSPSSDYAYSKLDAEKCLMALCEKGLLRNLVILRLSPVYDREWTFNLERRVLAPKKMAYLKFGSGRQKMSALARPNLVEFIQFLLSRSSKNIGIEIMNVSDTGSYEFNEIIQVFKNSNLYPKRPTISIPLPIVWLATRIAGIILTNKKKWLHSGYNKLASSLVFDNSKMLKTGFEPRHSLHTIFLNNN